MYIGTKVNLLGESFDKNKFKDDYYLLILVNQRNQHVLNVIFHEKVSLETWLKSIITTPTKNINIGYII